MAWDDFNRAVMGLNAKEALFVACALEKTGISSLHRRTIPARRHPTQDLPEMLLNYSFGLNSEESNLPLSGEKIDAFNKIIAASIRGDSSENSASKYLSKQEKDPSFDAKKVTTVLKLILSSRLNDIDAYTKKLAERVEFQSLESQATMPVQMDALFERAYLDMEDGSQRGLAWACFQLRQVFASPAAGKLDENEALQLYADLQGLPSLLLDVYGEAGFDVALKMEKMLSKIGDMPYASPASTALEMEMR